MTEITCNTVKKQEITEICDSAGYHKAQWVLLLCEGVWRVCAFVWKCVTHTKELRAAWPSWCCCHADIEPSESPGELKPCREEISALFRENSVKTNATVHSKNSLKYQLQYRYRRREQEITACSTNAADAAVFRAHQRDCRRWACLSTPGPVGVNWGW